MKQDRQPQTTHKKIKVIGTKKYLDPLTGEIEDFQVSEFEERDFNFTKIWMRNFIASLEIVGNQKTRVAYWIIEHLSKDNLLTMTYRQISEATKISLDTVRITMKILVDSDFLRRVNQGCYVVNPNIVFKGSHNGRMNILQQYNDAEKQTHSEQTDKEKLENLLHAIQTLQKQAEKLQNKIKETEETKAKEKAS